VVASFDSAIRHFHFPFPFEELAHATEPACLVRPACKARASRREGLSTSLEALGTCRRRFLELLLFKASLFHKLSKATDAVILDVC